MYGIMRRQPRWLRDRNAASNRLAIRRTIVLPAIHWSRMSHRIRVFATCDIGDALNILRQKGYDVEVYPKPEAPPKSLIVEKVKSGIDGLITTLRDPIDAEVFAAGKNEAGKTTLKVIAQD